MTFNPQPSNTIVALLEATFNARADQACIVRRPVGLNPAGIMVLLVGEAAVLKIGGAFLTFAKDEANDLGNPAKLPNIDFQKSTDDIFNWLEKMNRSDSARRWAYGIFFLGLPSPRPAGRGGGGEVNGPTIDPHHIRCALCCVSGTDLCIKLAAELTTRGLPCSLT